MKTISEKSLILRSIFLLVPMLILQAPQVAAESIYSCVHKTNGNVRVVSAPGQCHENSENALSWESAADLAQLVNSLLSRADAIENALGLFNEPPTVNVGADQVTLLSESISLEATATDDGILYPLTYLWEKVTGPGEALFSNPESYVTDAYFTEIGTYELELNVTDGLATVPDGVTVVVYPDNTPPTIDAGGYRIGDATSAFISGDWVYIRSCYWYLEAIVDDDGFPSAYTVKWSFDPSSITTYPYQIPVSAWAWNFSNDTSASTYFQSFGIRYSRYPFRPIETIEAFSTDLTISVNDGYHTTTETVRVYCRSPHHPDWQPN